MKKRIQRVNELLTAFRKQKEQPQLPKKIIFNGVEGYDVYNTTAPFAWNEEIYIIGRVEKRDSEHSKAVFFVQDENGQFKPKQAIKQYDLQDPYISFIGNTIVFGGTEIFPHPDNPEKLAWRAKFYYGTDLTNLQFLTNGPTGMKDIRLIELKDKRIGVFSRPQGDKGKRGKIGFTIVDNLHNLTPVVINDALLLEQFDDEEWGGCNEATLLSNGKVGVLGHIAKFSTGDVRHYYPMVFCIDPLTGEYSDMKIIAERQNFLPGPSKRDDLIDVLFSSGIKCHGNGYATLYTGVSDVEAQQIEIVDPFLEFVK